MYHEGPHPRFIKSAFSKTHLAGHSRSSFIRPFCVIIVLMVFQIVQSSPVEVTQRPPELRTFERVG